MRYLKLSILLLLFPAILFAQSGWVLQHSGTNATLNDVFMINENTGYAAGNMGVILKTTNSGNNWSNIFGQTNYDAVSVNFLNLNTGWIYLRSYSERDSTFFLKTTNNGVSWNRIFIDTNLAFGYYINFHFLNENTGYLADSWKLRKTTNGGLNWSVLFDSLPTGVYFINEQTGWIGRFNAGLWKSTDAGTSWFQQIQFSPHQYNSDIYFVNEYTGFFASGSPLGTLYRTTNRGLNWDWLYIDVTGFSFPNENTGYAITSGMLGYEIAKTTNTGVNWVIHSFNTNVNVYMRSIYFPSVNTGWAVGSFGVILKTTSGGVTIGIDPISTEIPNDYSLSQNYPNPFNPQTNIRFEIPRAALVILKVYNSLGEEITTLTNEELRAGVYEVQFDATNLPSGMYYYRIAAGNYTQTKKMVLVK